MQRKLLAILSVFTVAVLLTLAIGAAETVTVDKNTNLTAAISALKGQGGTIVIAEDTTVTGDISIPEQSGDLTITGKQLTVSGSIKLSKNTNNNVVTFDMPLKTRGQEAKIFGGFNNIVFTKNFTVDGSIDFYGGVNSYETTDGTTGENNYEVKMNEEAIAELPYSITVNEGTFGAFGGGNYRASYSAILGAIAAPVSITVNGGTFGSGVSFNADSALKLDAAFSISGMSILADNATLTINGGTFNTPIYAQGYLGQTSVRTSGDSQKTNSDAKYYAADGDIRIDIKGGTFNGCEISATQSAATYSQVLRGNYTVTVDKKANLAKGIVFDATQVKTYAGGSAKASITYPSGADLTAKRFDSENGKTKKYDEPLRIAFLGDSITQGSNAYVDGELSFETKSYPAQFLEKMVASGKDVVVSNYGCSATRILNYDNFCYTEGLAYTLSMKETDADYVVVALGTNDSLACTNTYGMKDRFAEEYAAFVSGYEALPDTDMVFGTCAIYRDSRDVAAVAVRGLQEKVFESLKAAGKKCTYIDLFALLLEPALAGDLLANDLLHPDADGYTIYADRLYGAIVDGVCGVDNFEMTDIYVNSRAKLTGAGTKEDPTSSLAVAFAKAAPEATIHISGTYTYSKFDNANCGLLTPTSVKKLTIMGEGEGATLKLSTNYIFINSDITFDNITVESSAKPLHFVAGYNNVTFTESFKCDGAVLVAGFVAYGDVKTNAQYNSRESVTSNKDCTITVDGGKFGGFVGGNIAINANALIADYSGNLTVNIGKNASIGNDADNAACGQNSLSGSITLNIASTASGQSLRERAMLGNNKEAKAFDVARNTGTVTVNILDGANVTFYPLGDINSDGFVGVGDALQMLKCIKENSASRFNKNYYGLSTLFTEDTVKTLIANAAK